AENDLHRRVETVEIEAVEADLRRSIGECVVLLTKPTHEVEHIRVPPHPGRESPEPGQGIDRLRVATGARYVPMNAIGIGPVSLDGDGVKSLLADQAPRDDRSLAIKLVRSVRRLAEEHEPPIPDALEERRI